MNNVWHTINSDRVKPDGFVVIIEIEKGSKNKYELDKESGLLKLDRVLYTSTHYPANYGFIPKTLASDNDPLDVLVLCSEVIIPMTLVECIPIGVLRMADAGKVDEKIIAVCAGDPNYNLYTDISELPKHIFDEIKHFFGVYKGLENIEIEVKLIENSFEAKKVIENCINNYKIHFNKVVENYEK